MSVVSLCLGIDISPKRLGWALARLEDGAPVACGCEAIELPANGWDRKRLDSLLYVAEAAGGFGSGDMRNFYDAEVHYVAIELPALPPKSGTKSAFNAGRAYQEAVSAIRRRWPWAVLDEMQPSEWRKLAGLPGNASKGAVMAQAWEFITNAEGDISDLAESLLSQDAADAACIALAGVARNAATLATPSGQAAQ